MLSKPDARILSYIKSNGNVVFSDCAPDFFTPVRLDHLVSLGYINLQTHPSGIIIYQLLPSGEDALSSHREERNKRAQKKRDKNRKERLDQERYRKDAMRSWVQWTITTIISVASFFAGAIIEKLTGFMDWIWSMLH